MFISLLPPPVAGRDRLRQTEIVRTQAQSIGAGHLAVIADAQVVRDAGLAALDVDSETLRPDLLAARLGRVKSRWKLRTQVRTRRVPELEQALGLAVDRLRGRQDVEAILTEAASPGLTQLARRLKLPMVHCEHDAGDEPGWGLGRFEVRTTPRGVDTAQRFRTFCWQRHRAHTKLLSRDELLHLVGGDARSAAPAEARFKVGLALDGDSSDGLQRYRAVDLIAMAHDHVAPADILIRHPASALSQFSPACGVTDGSPRSADFVRRCDTVATVASSVALEAILMGRRTLVIGECPLRLAADKSFHARIDPAQQLLAINFLVLCFFVPVELMFDADYLRWRLSLPSEVALFERHASWLRHRHDAAAARQSA